MRKRIEEQPKKGIKIDTGIIKTGLVYFVSTFAAVEGYKTGCRLFERLVPSIIDKIDLTRAVVSTMAEDDEDDE